MGCGSSTPAQAGAEAVPADATSTSAADTEGTPSHDRSKQTAQRTPTTAQIAQSEEVDATHNARRVRARRGSAIPSTSVQPLAPVFGSRKQSRRSISLDMGMVAANNAGEEELRSTEAGAVERHSEDRGYRSISTHERTSFGTSLGAGAADWIGKGLEKTKRSVFKTDWLHAAGITPRESNSPRYSPVLAAVEDRDMRLLIETLHYHEDHDIPLDLNQAGDKGFTAMHLAAVTNQPTMIRKLALHGADVDARQFTHHYTPLHLAAYWGVGPAVSQLLKHDASSQQACSEGRLPLHLAAYMGHHTVILQLLDHDPDCIKWRDNDGRTALHLAAANGQDEAVQMLAQQGADLNAITPKEGHTPLHRATVNECAETASLLVKLGADPHHQGKDGRSAVEIATAAGRGDIADTLETVLADIEGSEEADLRSVSQIVKSGEIVPVPEDTTEAPPDLAAELSAASLASQLSQGRYSASQPDSPEGEPGSGPLEAEPGSPGRAPPGGPPGPRPSPRAAFQAESEAEPGGRRGAGAGTEAARASPDEVGDEEVLELERSINQEAQRAQMATPDAAGRAVAGGGPTELSTSGPAASPAPPSAHPPAPAPPPPEPPGPSFTFTARAAPGASGAAGTADVEQLYAELAAGEVAGGSEKLMLESAHASLQGSPPDPHPLAPLEGSSPVQPGP